MPRNKQHRQAASQKLDLPLEEAFVLGYNVERLRRAQAINKVMFAQMARISRPTLNKVERGESNVKLSVLRRLADALNVTVVDLLTPPHDPQSIPFISMQEATLRAFPDNQQPHAGS